MKFNLIFILVLQTCYAIALLSTRPIVSLFADMNGASAMTIGFLVSSFAFFPMLLAVSIGKWLDHFGAKNMVLIGGLGMLTALVIPVIYPGIPALFISQVLIGVSQLLTLVSLQKTVGNIEGNRDKNIALFSLAGSTGELIGPLLSGYTFEQFGFQATFSLAASFVFVAVVSGIFINANHWKIKSPDNSSGVKDNQVPKTTTIGFLKQPNLRKALMVSGLVLYSKDLFVAYFPIYGNSIGISPMQIGLILSLMAGMAMVVRILQFRLVEQFGRITVLVTTLILSGIAYICIPFTTSIVLLMVIAVILGGGLGLGQPISLVYVIHLSSYEQQGQVLGLRLMTNRFSQFSAPLLFGGIGKIAGLSPIFLISGAILLAGSYFTRMKEDQEEKVEQEKHG